MMLKRFNCFCMSGTGGPSYPHASDFLFALFNISGLPERLMVLQRNFFCWLRKIEDYTIQRYWNLITINGLIQGIKQTKQH